MLFRRKMAGIGAEPAHDQEDGPDQDVEAVEAGGHVEGRRIDAVLETEGGVAVLHRLQGGEADPEQDGDAETEQQVLAVAVEQRRMRRSKSVVSGKSVSVRVDVGGRGIITDKNDDQNVTITVANSPKINYNQHPLKKYYIYT